MKASRIARSRYMALVWSATLWVASLVFAGLIGGLWFLLAADSARSATPPAAVLALTAVGIAWQQSRARARRRLQGALDAYAEREMARSRLRHAQSGLRPRVAR